MQNFLSSFTQRFNNDDDHLYDILNNESLWIKSIPHDNSGVCYTYNPKKQSDPGYWFAISISPNIDQMPGLSYEEKRRKFFGDIKVFLHEPNKFFYSKEEEGPNNIAIDLSLIQLMNKKYRVVGKEIYSLIVEDYIDNNLPR